MKTKILLSFTLWIIMYSQIGICQNIPVRSNVKNLENESIDDLYLPNQWNNKKTSPSYFDERKKEIDSFIVSIRTIQVNVDSNGLNIIDDAANEPSIAINPFDTNSIAIGWRQFDNIESNFRQAGWSNSADGGITWTASVIDPGEFRSDPVLDYDLQNNFYYNSLDPFPDWQCDVFKSSDGGANWDAGTYAYGGDKQWMTIDRTTGEGSGNIYAVWTSSYSACAPGDFTRSTDGNLSYEPCEHIESEPYYGMPAVNGEGVLYVAGGGDVTTLTVTKSLNAEIPGADIIWDDAVNVDLAGSMGGWGSINPEGLLGQTNIDIDISGGPGHGNVYVLASVSPDTGPDEADVAFSKSTDGGLTWSDPIWINDEKGEGFTHWFGTMSVAPNGRIDVIWLDTRDGGGSDSSSLYYCYSLDQGEIWSSNMKLSDKFNPHVGYPSQNKMGDYFDMTSDNDGAHLAWANTMNGEQDVYYSRILLTKPEVISTIEENFNEVKIFPNPATGIFNISGIQPGMQLKICNALGEQLKYLEAQNSDITIDLRNMPFGLYFIQIINLDGGSFSARLVKN